MSPSNIRKLYYSIGEVSTRTGLEPHVLRYWETEFKQLSPKKNRAGNRVYTEDDIETVERIQLLVHEEKYTLEGARRVMAQKQAVSSLLGSRKSDLIQLRAFLSDVLQSVEGEDG